jgi:lipopolysaccharide export system protein LptA
MHSQVAVNWRGARPGSKPMRVEAGELRYLEREARIILTSWSKLTRQQMTLNAGPASITLEDGAIKLVETERAHGVDHQPGRELEYSARYLSMHFAANSEIEKLIGDGDARLVATSDSARTTTTADRLELNFQTQSGESLLENALATGKATVESKPQVRAGIATPATRVLRGEMVQLHMQPDGKSLQRVENHSPGTLDFVPNRPDERARHIDAERMGMDYSAGNRLETFRAVNVATRTDPPSTRAKDPAMLTWSKDLLADFDPKTGEMRRLEQWRDFRYEEGDRKGRADHAIFETPPDRITLKGSARFQDTTGSLAADEIARDQKSGDVLATGHVASSRLPDRKGGGSTVMLSQDEPILAKAARMTTRERNQLVRYEGEAILWQGANRLRAERIEIDRKQDRLSASGGVVSQFQDSPPKPAAGKPAARSKAAPVLTIVRSPELLYIDRERVAHYSGGAHLTRPGMDVKAREIRAYLSDRDAEPKSDSSLDRATADGRVEIVQRDGNRTRRGTAEHADYNVAQEKVVLEGGEPVLDDNLSGTTRGAKLTYFARNGRLLVDGAPSRPAESRIIRK